LGADPFDQSEISTGGKGLGGAAARERERPSPLFGAVVEGGEVGADLVGFWHSEVGVQAQRVLVMVAAEFGVAEGVEGVAEAGVGAGLLGAVADVGGDCVGGGVAGEGGGVVAGWPVPARPHLNLAEVVQRAGFAVPVTGLPAQGQGLLVVFACRAMPDDRPRYTKGLDRVTGC
jgi:hypothetical protein